MPKTLKIIYIISLFITSGYQLYVGNHAGVAGFFIAGFGFLLALDTENLNDTLLDALEKGNNIIEKLIKECQTNLTEHKKSLEELKKRLQENE
jgi:hypothetical protein